MAYTVTIQYVGLTKPVEGKVANIGGEYLPEGNYTDTPAYKGTVYDTNVPGLGYEGLTVPEPYATTSVPLPFPGALAQFKMAQVATNNTVSFEVDDYKEAFFYQNIAPAMVKEGFAVTVAPVVVAP